MGLERWKKISSSPVRDNDWWTYRLDTYELPSGRTGEYHYVHTEGSSMVVPVLDDDKIVMVRQYRYLCNRESLEFPAGGVKKGMSYRETAEKELGEEAGYSASQMEFVGEFNPCNGVTDEICQVFLARGLREVQAAPDVTEQFEIIRVTPDNLDRMIASREIWDGMTLAAWALVRSRIRPG